MQQTLIETVNPSAPGAVTITTLRSGRTLTGAIHGAGGVVKTLQRMVQVLDWRTENDDTVTIWTDPDNADPAARGTTVKARDIVQVEVNGNTAWTEA
uniref:Uncharacterized protein n=1 Tax=uncultured Caudovirales phage TaxID=2100421 RepID=A0A6J5L2R3_9CAUD|nr:hypothetical protein UFOVP114_88 [uncultured Caudovirales phage]